jgi:hypothetical protein
MVSETNGGKSGRYTTSTRPKDRGKKSMGSAEEEVKV